MSSQNFFYFFPFFVIAISVLIIYALSKMAWTDLVDKYALTENFDGKKLGVISAKINSVSYSNALVLKYNEQGFFLKPIFILSLFHKPILIPWKEIIEVREKKVLFSSFVKLVIGNPFVALITIKKNDFQEIEDFYNTFSSLNK